MDQALPLPLGRPLAEASLSPHTVDLHLGGAHLTTITPPVVGVGRARIRRGHAPRAVYREALAALVGQLVQEVEVQPWESLLLGFAADSWLVISLQPQDRREMEAAIVRAGEQWWAW